MSWYSEYTCGRLYIQEAKHGNPQDSRIIFRKFNLVLFLKSHHCDNWKVTHFSLWYQLRLPGILGSTPSGHKCGHSGLYLTQYSCLISLHQSLTLLSYRFSWIAADPKQGIGIMLHILKYLFSYFSAFWVLSCLKSRWANPSCPVFFSCQLVILLLIF